MRLLFIYLFILLGFSINAQVDKSIDYIAHIDLELIEKQICQGAIWEREPLKTKGHALNSDWQQADKRFCFNLLRFKTAQKGQGFTIVRKLPNGKKWAFKFRFGFVRTHYHSTTMHLKTSRTNVRIKNFEFRERTTASAYNPSTWQKPLDALRWIDEPTNMFQLSAERGSDVIYFTYFHPKFLIKKGQIKKVEGLVNDIPVNEYQDITAVSDKLSDLELVTFRNTFMQSDIKIGYGRKLTLAQGKDWGRITYTPSMHLGFAMGRHVDGVVDSNGDIREHREKTRLHGPSISIGQMLEYEYKMFSLFIDNKVTYSHIKHGYLNGEAKYNLLYTTLGFGMGFRLFQVSPRSRRIPLP